MSRAGVACGWSQLSRDRRGVAAVEFAIIAPLMLVMLMGTIEVVNLVRVQIKLNVAAGQLAEMIAGQPSVTEASSAGGGGSLGDMCIAASYNLLPYSRTTLSALVGSATVTPAPAPALDWFTDKACPTAVQGTAATASSAITAADSPKSLFTTDGTPFAGGGTAIKGYSAISVQMTYVYENIIPFLQSSSITLKSVASARPRSNTTIPCTYPSGNTAAACKLTY